jgi:hypothetical protein
MNDRQKADMQRWERAETDGTITPQQAKLLAHWRKMEKMEKATDERERAWREQE